MLGVRVSPCLLNARHSGLIHWVYETWLRGSIPRMGTMEIFIVTYRYGYDYSGDGDCRILTIKNTLDSAVEYTERIIGKREYHKTSQDTGASYEILNPKYGDYEYFYIAKYVLGEEYEVNVWTLNED